MYTYLKHCDMWFQIYTICLLLLGETSADDCLGPLTHGTYNYQGTQNMTKSGIRCQRWDSSFPQTPDKDILKINKDMLKSMKYFCRTPTKYTIPWCYTTDTYTEWEECGIPRCIDRSVPTNQKDCLMLTKIKRHNYHYSGTMSVTVSQAKCKRWDDESLNKTFLKKFSMLRRKKLSNFCRQFDEEYSLKPWCFSLNGKSEREYCDIPVCGDPKECIIARTTKDEYYHNYLGTMHVTESGNSCRRWAKTSSFPMFSVYEQSYILDYPEDQLQKMSNYCRQIEDDGTYRPYCYTTDSNTIREFCHIPVCKDPCVGPKMNKLFYYGGNKNETKSGEKCQRWDSVFPDDYISKLSQDVLKSMGNYCYGSDTQAEAWCYTINTTSHWGLCETQCVTIENNCLGPKIDGKYYYQGTQHITRTNRKCQRWDSNLPHKPDGDILKIGIDKLESMEDFCRTPTSSHSVPWCYTMDNNTRWEECGIATCHDGLIPTDNCLGSFNNDKYYYHGTQNITKTGKSCQRWDSSNPHVPNEFVLKMGNTETKPMQNYCRNPTKYSVPWCYTTNPNTTWEECGIPTCNDGSIPTNQEECLMRTKIKGNNFHYLGTMSVTKSNRTCQFWGHDKPHNISKVMKSYSKLIKRLSNYCRQFDGDEETTIKPWCYTTDSNIEWEYCNIPMCAGPCLGPRVNAVFYFSGTQNVTKSKRKCQRWDAYKPHEPNKTITALGIKIRKSMENYCYTSEFDEYPWCYTIDENREWEYCDNAECYTMEKNCLGPYINKYHYYKGTQHFTKSKQSCKRWDSLDHPEATITNAILAKIIHKRYENYCRSEYLSHVPWCFTIGPNSTQEECGIAKCDDGSIPTNNCLDLLIDGKYSYEGSQNVTKTGKSCQRWDAMSPHVPTRAVLKLGNDILKSMENYCRISGPYSIPWCYTMDPKYPWEECGIPTCDKGLIATNQEECLTHTKLEDNNYRYSGTLSVTESNRKCQFWANDKPHAVSKYIKTFSMTYLKIISNYCRQFQGDKRIKPWCYTTDSNIEWEYCNIPMCAGPCLGPKVNPLFYFSGTQNVTKSGRKCQRWDESKPHKPYETTIELGMKIRKLMKNYCYTSDTHAYPWCYTMDKEPKWENCDNAECYTFTKNCLGPYIDKKHFYQGTQNVTKTGKICQRWNSVTPNTPNSDILKLNEYKLKTMENYCRTPTSYSVPWCYTMDPNYPWEECGIKTCENGLIPTNQKECLMRTKLVNNNYHYSGTQNKTVSGKICRHWAHFKPHPIFQTMTTFSLQSRKNASNYCRQIEGDKTKVPWCYTTDIQLDWEYCDIPMCAGPCLGPKVNKNFFFSGTQTVTKSGIKCQRWDASKPHEPYKTTIALGIKIRKSMDNYCYTSDTHEYPWCYTMVEKPKWDYCENAECYTITNNCLGPVINGTYFYQGTQSVTRTNKTCQRWISLSPDVADSIILKFNNYTLRSMKNYCRTPLTTYSIPWCYTTYPNSAWEECGIKRCDDGFVPTDQHECLIRTKRIGHNYHYSGTKSVTISGKTCQHWALDKPHKVFKAMRSFSMDIRKNISNYCRQFDEDLYRRPWCYTTLKQSKWEFCDIPLCPGDCLGPKINAVFYFSGTQTVTTSGKTCRRWDVSSPTQPHVPGLLNLNMKALSPMENYCSTSDMYEKPWCYYTQDSWEECDFATCYTIKNNCKGPIVNGQYFYRGTQRQTQSLFDCLRWDSLHQHENIYKTVDKDIIKLGNATLKSMENYCRTTRRFDTPFCYTKRYNSLFGHIDFCGIRDCENLDRKTNK